jgi:enamine deaminase RidA (YjgF/YER057c/UK114 family)
MKDNSSLIFTEVLTRSMHSSAASSHRRGRTYNTRKLAQFLCAGAAVAMSIKHVNPKGWPDPSGYSNVIVGEGKLVAIAGQIGCDPLTEELVSDDFAQQSRQALANVLTALEAAGGKAEHLIRLTWYITERDAFLRHSPIIEEAHREELGGHSPVMSVVVVSGLLEPRAKVQIEATALIKPTANTKATKVKAKKRKRSSA